MSYNILKNIKLMSPLFPALCLGALLMVPAYAAPLDQKNPSPAAIAHDTGKKDGTGDASFGSYLSGRFAESQGDTENGIRFLRESLKHDPGNKETLASLYRMLILSGKVEDAISLARDLAGTKVVEEGNEFTPEMLLALEDGRKGQYAAAIKRLQSINKVGFNTLLVPLLEAWCRLGAGEVTAAVDVKDMVSDARIVLPHIHLNAAFINDIAGFDAQALRQYEAAIKDERFPCGGSIGQLLRPQGNER
jgi:tetratricopeptide (TPR) repeat protein